MTEQNRSGHKVNVHRGRNRSGGWLGLVGLVRRPGGIDPDSMGSAALMDKVAHTPFKGPLVIAFLVHVGLVLVIPNSMGQDRPSVSTFTFLKMCYDHKTLHPKAVLDRLDKEKQKDQDEAARRAELEKMAKAAEEKKGAEERKGAGGTEAAPKGAPAGEKKPGDDSKPKGQSEIEKKLNEVDTQRPTKSDVKLDLD